MTLDETVDALIFLQAEMRRRKIRTDIPCCFYADSPREVVHLTPSKKDMQNMEADPHRYLAPNSAFVGIPLKDAIEGERR